MQSVSKRLRAGVCGVTLVVTLGMVMFAAAPGGRAGDPIPTMRNVYGAPYAVITVFEVKAGTEPQFLDAMVKSGPYNKLLSGFANERILQPLPTAKAGTVTYSSIGRYYDLATANFVEKQRDAAIRQFLAAEPIRLEAKLVEHWLGDWGWETPQAKHGATRVEPFKNDEIFQKRMSSLSYFKSGYIGQVGVLELFPKGATLEQIRSGVQHHAGLSGSSIYAVAGGERYVCYCEFFKSSGSGADVSASGITVADNTAVGVHPGIVVQNYVPR